MWSDFDSQHPYAYPSPNHTFSSTQLPLLRLSEGYILVWPLYTAGMMNIATEPVQRWVVEMLRLIGQTMATQQAFALADMLEQKIILNEPKRVQTDSLLDLSDIDSEIDLIRRFEDYCPSSTDTMT